MGRYRLVLPQNQYGMDFESQVMAGFVDGKSSKIAGAEKGPVNLSAGNQVKRVMSAAKASDFFASPVVCGCTPSHTLSAWHGIPDLNGIVCAYPPIAWRGTQDLIGSARVYISLCAPDAWTETRNLNDSVSCNTRGTACDTSRSCVFC